MTAERCLICGNLVGWRYLALGETHFWRQSILEPSSSTLSTMHAIALVKFFVLEWSSDLDYQMYRDFPLELYLGRANAIVATLK